jgi:hypothetical protein
MSSHCSGCHCGGVPVASAPTFFSCLVVTSRSMSVPRAGIFGQTLILRAFGRRNIVARRYREGRRDRILPCRHCQRAEQRAAVWKLHICVANCGDGRAVIADPESLNFVSVKRSGPCLLTAALFWLAATASALAQSPPLGRYSSRHLPAMWPPRQRQRRWLRRSPSASEFQSYRAETANPISSIAQIEGSGTTSAKAAGIGALRLAGFENLML